MPGAHHKVAYDPQTDSYYEGAAQAWVWRGLTWAGVADRLFRRVDVTRRLSAEHDRLAAIWRRIATPMNWFTAVLAAISGISLVSDNAQLSVVLSFATAVVAATNAALNPAATARDHRTAALAYDRLAVKLDDFAYFTIEDWGDAVSAEARAALRKQLSEFDEELKRISDAAPGVRVRHDPRLTGQPPQVLDDRAPGW